MKNLYLYQKRSLVTLIIIAISTSIFAGPKKPAEWTILTYMQADNNLAPFAKQNIEILQKTPSSRLAGFPAIFHKNTSIALIAKRSLSWNLNG